MKLKLHKCAVLGLVIPVFFSAIFCCCLTETLHARQTEPACYSTNHQGTPHQNADDCGGCDRSMAIIQASAVMDIAVVKTVTPVIVYPARDLLALAVLQTIDHSPPAVFDTAPLYLKHSILRI